MSRGVLGLAYMQQEQCRFVWKNPSVGATSAAVLGPEFVDVDLVTLAGNGVGMEVRCLGRRGRSGCKFGGRLVGDDERTVRTRGGVR